MPQMSHDGGSADSPLGLLAAACNDAVPVVQNGSKRLSMQEATARQPPNRGKAPSKSRRPKQEIEVLQAQAKEIESRLQDMRRGETSWQHVAQSERLAVHQGRREHDELRLKLQDHVAIHTEMEALFHKKPKLNPIAASLVSTTREAWQSFHLPAIDDPWTNRLHAMHAILDREYGRMPHILRQEGLLDVVEPDAFRCKLIPPHATTATFAVHAVDHLTLDAPFDIVSATLWRLLGTIDESETNGLEERVDHIDDDTLYRRTCDTRHPVFNCRANMLTKRYAERDGDVIVTRSTLQDAQHPLATDKRTLVENVTGWIRMAALPQSDQCRYTFMTHHIFSPDTPLTPAEVDAMASLMETLSKAQRPSVPGLFPLTPPTQHMQGMQFPPCFLVTTRSMRFDRVVKSTLNAAIVAHRRTRTTP
ncbi:Aste57867_23724 [Aphanomyces stellatus]|uniref:Aste57867_23724 protein n=1 Tax=Aphanomyces stellatus TaxID=120398 RepID=A0A485LNE9_9STRA|nr:hypothetical protein As57867_023652 [Aphanomyces stellatus]VFU00369.1 Aste57867_23724 [Aphanomyces stellatus]